MRRPHQHQRSTLRKLLFVCTGLILLPSGLAFAVPMQNDPNGFEGIPWGAGFTETADFKLVDDGPRVKGYELVKGPPPLGGAKVDAMRFVTLNGKFVRVTIRYHSPESHKQIVDYFQAKYGPLDRTPGQISKGGVQQFNWRGDDTLITLTYETAMDRGIIFFESRALALKLSEEMMAPEPDLGGATY